MVDLHPNPTERVPVLVSRSPDVAMTTSYDDVFPATVHARYDFAETRNAARILQATNPEQFEDLVAAMVVLDLGPAATRPASGGE